MFGMKRIEQLPALVAVERRGTVVVLHVRTPGGELTRVYCGPHESFNPCLWTWNRNAGLRAGQGDAVGFLCFRESDGREFRFAVHSEEELARFKAVVDQRTA